MKLFLNLKKSSSWKIWTTNATTNLRGVVHNSWLYSTRSEDSRPPHFIDLVDWIACSCIFNIKIFNTGWGFLYLIIKPIISVFHKVFENNIQKYYSKLSILLTLAKRRALPGYARDRGFVSSGKFWEICFLYISRTVLYTADTDRSILQQAVDCTGDI